MIEIKEELAKQNKHKKPTKQDIKIKPQINIKHKD
jgi:hypothetical protein